MSSDAEEPRRFSSWVARPQSLIALSALLLSGCGLFIAIYEATLIRRQQRAAVWPYVEVSASLTPERVQVRVQNTGVGPARVIAAAVSRDGQTSRGWADLIRQTGVDPEKADFYYSLIQGRVLPRDSDSEVLFRVTRAGGPAAAEVIARLGEQILSGQVDVTLCYCSVYDECWTSSLREVVQRSRGLEAAGGDRSVPGCDAAPRSGI